MLSNNSFGKWVLTITSIIILVTRTFAIFTYPTSTSLLDFHVGDTIVVEWTSSFKQPYLELYGGYHEQPFVHEPVSASGSYDLKLAEDWEYPNNYLQLTGRGGNFRTTLFQIQAANGTAKTWRASSTSNVAPSTNNNIPGDSSGSSIPTDNNAAGELGNNRTSDSNAATEPANGTSASGATETVRKRPNITLDSDSNNLTSYLLPDKTNCTSNDGIYHTGCWELLNMTYWLPQWFLNTPQCTDGEDRINCNNAKANEPWTTTFLRQYSGGGMEDCTGIGTTCVNIYNQNDGINDDPLLRARFLYGYQNIHAIYAFFNSWDTAVQQAMRSASQLVGAIIHEVDPEKKTHVKLNVALTAVSIGLGFIPVVGPEFAGLSALAISAANLGLSAIKKAPSVAAYIWPQGTVDSGPQQIDTLESKIDFLQTSLSINLGLGLSSVQGLNQSNVSQFLAFANGGSFSAPDMDLPQVLGGKGPPPGGFETAAAYPLLLAFSTYLVSTALAQNGWHIIQVPGVDPMAYSNHSLDGCPAWTTECSPKKADLECDGYEVTGQCNGTYWWYSTSQNTAYTLNHNDGTDSTGHLAKILRSGWTTGTLLFENAAICNIQNMLNQTIPKLYYTTSHGIAGFAFQGDVPNVLSGLTSEIDSTTNFIPMNGAGLSHLSTVAAYAAQLFHPTDNLWNFDASGLDFSCTSQLNVSIANSWGHPWTKRSPSS
ncbi:MAG: hypothetical protein M1836_006827 [Candelina mexicana]|nr:MAG: hypothetical protein M1836_006827 [Candelina mexicana]